MKEHHCKINLMSLGNNFPRFLQNNIFLKTENDKEFFNLIFNFSFSFRLLH